MMGASDADDASDLPGALAEIDRLRTLVGPSERDYAALVSDVQTAQAAIREAEAGVGELRGKIVELHVELDRLRQRCDERSANGSTRGGVTEAALARLRRILGPAVLAIRTKSRRR